MPKPTKPHISSIAASVIADELEKSLSNARVVGLALKGANFDGQEEITRLLYRGVEDGLYGLLRDLRGEDHGLNLVNVSPGSLSETESNM